MKFTNVPVRSEAVKELADHVAKNDDLNKELTALLDEMKDIHARKQEKTKMMKAKSKKWDCLQQQKDEATTKFDEMRKQDESLHAEMVETNKRRKANMTSIKTVISIHEFNGLTFFFLNSI